MLTVVALIGNLGSTFTTTLVGGGTRTEEEAGGKFSEMNGGEEQQFPSPGKMGGEAEMAREVGTVPAIGGVPFEAVQAANWVPPMPAPWKDRETEEGVKGKWETAEEGLC